MAKPLESYLNKTWRGVRVDATAFGGVPPQGGKGAGLATAFGGVPPQAEKTVKEAMFYVYILESMTRHHHYVGYTEDVTTRLQRHNNGKVKSTKANRPWRLVYIETFMNKQDAYKRERQIKSYKGGEAFKKLLK